MHPLTDARNEADTPPPLLTDVHGAAARYNVSWRTFFRWGDAGLVPAGFKIGGSRLWSIDQLERHIRDGCKPVRRGAR